MASLRSFPKSPYWFACFTLPDGSRTQRSTRVPITGLQQPEVKPLKDFLKKSLGLEVSVAEPVQANPDFSARDARRLAQYIANCFEDAAKEARLSRLTEARARKVIGDIYESANQEKLPGASVKEYLAGWLTRKELEAGDHTHLRYSSAVEQFLEHMGARAAQDMALITPKDFIGFRDALAKRVTANTTNVTLKILRSAFNQAWRDGLVQQNEAARVSLLKRDDKFERRPFTMEELKRILEVADEEWKGMILFGLYCGARLGDLSTLTWQNIDLARKEVRFTTEKTSRRQIVPLAKPVLRYLESLPAGDDPAQPLFPRAYAAATDGTTSGRNSKRFYALLVEAGLLPKRTHKSTGKGRSNRREQNEISFHCLRHTATSLLKNAGISDAVAMDLIGHESSLVSANYTHIDDDTKRAAVDALPDVTATPAKDESQKR
jgi:integrase